MKEEYKWNYDIKVKTKDGEFQYERETLDEIDDILEKHPNYEMVHATHVKKLVRGTKNVRFNNKNKV